MDKNQAREQLKAFLQGMELTFSIETYPNEEWVARCNEIPAIVTGGRGDNITDMDNLIRDAILTAAGVDTQYVNMILKFKGYKAQEHGFFFSKQNAEAEYALSS
jgi:hypothetical protein